MMKQISRVFMSFGVFAMVLALLFVVAPAQGALAQGGQMDQGVALLQEPPVDPPVDDPDIIIVPETGGNQRNVILDNWIIWVILGAVIIALLAALIARGSTSQHHHD